MSRAEQQGRGMVMSDVVYTLDPLTDPRWPGFVDYYPAASVFHSRGWLRALQMTYGYEPLVVTTSRPTERLTNALVFCIVRSWMTGARIVSLPFTDHCEPLVENVEQFHLLCAHLETMRSTQSWKYAEMRTGGAILGSQESFRECHVYQWHRLDLRPSLDALYKNFHADCIKRRIRHAERQELRIVVGRNELLVQYFFQLMVLMRSRKHLPPQPFEWFQNLVAVMEKNVCIWMAFKGDQPVAGILTINHRKTMYYKYSASDAELNNLGAIPMLLWKVIQAAKAAGMEELDLGRSDLDNRGLIRFKERWGARSARLAQWRSPNDESTRSAERFKMRLAKTVCACVPHRILVMAGRLTYRHVG